jgi:hypothetical protein
VALEKSVTRATLTALAAERATKVYFAVHCGAIALILWAVPCMMLKHVSMNKVASNKRISETRHPAQQKMKKWF